MPENLTIVLNRSFKRTSRLQEPAAYMNRPFIRYVIIVLYIQKIDKLILE